MVRSMDTASMATTVATTRANQDRSCRSCKNTVTSAAQKTSVAAR
jgi:hypothetical protein